MNVGSHASSERVLFSGFTLNDLAACCVPIVVLVASIASLL